MPEQARLVPSESRNDTPVVFPVREEHSTMTTPPSATRHSFIVRVWQEDEHPGWRGWVQHVRSGETAYIHNAKDLLVFMERQVEIPVHRPRSEALRASVQPED